MKKIVKPNGDIRLKGFSEKDGVAFFAPPSNKVPMSFLDPFIGTVATVDENNAIDCHMMITNEPTSSIDRKVNKIAEFVCKVLFFSILVFTIAFFVCSFTEKTFLADLLFTLLYMAMAVLSILKGFIIFVARILGDKEFKNFSKFLAAKNAVENAYYDLKKVPTIEELKNYSIFSPTSKYLVFDNTATVLILICIVRFLPGVWYWIIISSVLVVIVVLQSKGVFFFWQLLIVSKPENIHYEVALKALENTLEFHDSISVSVTVQEFNGELFSEEKCNGCELYDFCKKEMECSHEKEK